ncbi:MAG: hypothetical protein AAF619_02635 [Pseudomonadota bacterium]
MSSEVLSNPIDQSAESDSKAVWRRIDVSRLVQRITIPYFAYWTIASIFFGMWISPFIVSEPVNAIDHSAHYAHDHAMHQGEFPVDAASAPSVSVNVTRDPMQGWNLRLDTENFELIPATAGLEDSANEGHAHLYINGEKMSRLYGEAYHLGVLPIGEVEIKVTLNTNNHANLMLHGQRIEAVATITNAPTVLQSVVGE